jgi:pentatricopeptide repeat protein
MEKERCVALKLLDKKRPIQGLLGVHSRYGLHTRAVTVYRDMLSEGFSHFVTSMTAPVASGWSGRRVGFTPTGKRRLSTAHATSGLMHCSKQQL